MHLAVTGRSARLVNAGSPSSNGKGRADPCLYGVSIGCARTRGPNRKAWAFFFYLTASARDGRRSSSASLSLLPSTRCVKRLLRPIEKPTTGTCPTCTLAICGIILRP